MVAMSRPAPGSAPLSAPLFTPVEDAYGTRLALVFGNEAPGGRCPFYGRQCRHCDLGAGEGVRFTPRMNRERLRWFRAHYRAVLPHVRHLVVYNSGSVLNPEEMSPETLARVLGFAAELPECRVVSLDTREVFVDPATLRRLTAPETPPGTGGRQSLRLILGLESQKDEIRIGSLNKRMTRRNVERFFATLSGYRERVGADLNVVFQPPPLAPVEAVREAVATVEYGLELGHRHGVSVDFNLHPYYPGRVGLRWFPDHPRADLAALEDALEAMSRLVAERGAGSHLFVGLEDEGHDRQPARRRAELEVLGARIARFNAGRERRALGEI
jgi:hypothetical protein